MYYDVQRGVNFQFAVLSTNYKIKYCILKVLKSLTMTADESNSNYWETGIKDTRSKRARISCEGVDNQEPLDFDVDTLSVQEIKEMLKERGVKTRFRYLKKLKKQLIESFKNKESRRPVVPGNTISYVFKY